MSSTSLTLTQHKVTKTLDALCEHPLYEIIDSIHQAHEENEPYIFGDLGAWGFTLQCVVNTFERRKETMTQYAESWLWLGELRSQVRLVCNAKPETTEEDEIYFRDHPEEISTAFETFICSVLFNLVGISSLS